MIAIYLIAAHLVGDFVLQTRWQAAGKFSDPWIRMRHVDAYVVPFLPIVVWRCWGNGEGWHAGRGVAFMVALYALHFLTDSRRFTSTLGDWIAWNFLGAGPPAEKRGVHAAMMRSLIEHGERVPLEPSTEGGVTKIPGPGNFRIYGGEVELPAEFDLPPNPWPPIAILIDQTLHVCQFALLAGLLLT